MVWYDLFVHRKANCSSRNSERRVLEILFLWSYYWYVEKLRWDRIETGAVQFAEVAEKLYKFACGGIGHGCDHKGLIHQLFFFFFWLRVSIGVVLMFFFSIGELSQPYLYNNPYTVLGFSFYAPNTTTTPPLKTEPTPTPTSAPTQLPIITLPADIPSHTTQQASFGNKNQAFGVGFVLFVFLVIFL